MKGGDASIIHMEIHVYSILAEKEQKEEKEKQPPPSHTQHKQTLTHTHKQQDTGYPALRTGTVGQRTFVACQLSPHMYINCNHTCVYMYISTHIPPGGSTAAFEV